MRNAYKIGALAIAGSLALAACGSSSSTSSSSGAGGGGGKTVVISTDLPLQGSSKDASDATNQAIQMYLDQIGNKVGDYTIEFKKYDDSTAAAGQWDQAQCTKNAQDHVANTNELAVMGTYNSGCAKIEVPVLNQDPNGPMLMVSQANTNPGLTKTWDAGEPDKYYPNKVRNYARVVTTDDNQGRAAAQFMAQVLKVKKCYILNDNETYGQGVAKAFQDEATKVGITVLGNDPWDGKQPSYTALFEKIKAQGPDCIYIGGIYDKNGGQLIKDKVAVLGDNTAVKMMGPDGFEGFTELKALPQGQGMYLSFPGLSTDELQAAGGAAAKLLTDYKAKYGALPDTPYALYGVAAVQVILAAIQKSDGTRKGVTAAVFSGDGITIPAETSAIGKELKIDPASGDVNVKDITILQIVNNDEKTVQPWPVAG
jgi:branched-chain amino acid transport system substrate-binding protein